MALEPKQQAFVEEYLKCRNAAEAARRAGYSEKTARVIGAQNLSKLNIQEEIARRTKEVAMEADEVLSRLADIARGSIEDFISLTYEPYPAAVLDLGKARERGVLHLIKKLKYDKDGNPEIELHDPQSALVNLGKHHKLFTDKVEHELSEDAKETAAALISAMRQAAMSQESSK